MRYYKIVLVGSTKLLYDCAEIASNEYTGIPICVFDVRPKKGLLKARIPFPLEQLEGGKTQMAAYLEGIKEAALVISVMNPFLIPEGVVKKPNLTMINLHHALLPKHPGRNAECWTIYEGDQLGGITWHFIDEGIDTGDIIVQKSIEIDATVTSAYLLKKCNNLAKEALRELLPLEALDCNRNIKQPMRTGVPHRRGEIPNGGELNLSWDVKKMIRFLNAMNYGGMDVMGKPWCYIEEKKWQITKWTFGIKPPEEVGFRMDRGALDYYFLNEGTTFCLQNLKPVSR